MKCLTAVAVVLVGVGRIHAAGNLVDGPDADLIYDYRSGDVVLDAMDTPSGVLVSFVFSNSEGLLTPVTPVYPERIPWPCLNCDNTVRQIGFFDFSNKGSARLDLGPIFPKGIATPAELSELLDSANYAYALGVGGKFDLLVVPEPGGGLLLLAFVTIGRRKARRRYRLSLGSPF